MIWVWYLFRIVSDDQVWRTDYLAMKNPKGQTGRGTWARYEAIIMDCDDTVLATAKTRWRALINAAKEFDRALTEQMIQVAWGRPFDDLIASILPGVNLDDFVAVYRVEMRREKPELTPGAATFLEMTSVRGVRVEAVTSSSRSLIIQDLDELGLTEYFAHVFGFEETKYAKPDPRALVPVLRELTGSGYKPEKTVYIGDSLSDHRVARGNNLDFIAVTTGLTSRQAFLSAGVPRQMVFKNLAEISETPDDYFTAD